MSIKEKLKVLIVDDTTTSRLLVNNSLSELGIRQVTMAEDGEEAYKIMTSNTPCHMIISDYNMPKMDGLELLKAIRMNAPISRTPFIILTGKGDRDLIIKARDLGANNYLNKPITTPSLKKAIEVITGPLR